MKDKLLTLSKFATKRKYTVKEATSILTEFGISKSIKTTRDLITKGELKATLKGDNPNDRRSGYEISEKALYDLVVKRIPIMKDYFVALKKD
ncbi:hypothetical protein OCD85_27640 [Bacillus pacificus]|nr:hypothetical protein [Bacillus pacificus]MCU5364682.1 hypothetical protein [Bacillus pacificus]MCU5402955.1 hypothetical protein [Bacillus pacificus]HDR7743930.1 hypothetical protein [Bacillus pacificus]